MQNMCVCVCVCSTCRFMVIEYNKVLLDGSLKDSTGQKKMEFVKDLHR